MTDEEAARLLEQMVREGHLRYWCQCACTLSDHASPKVSDLLPREFYVEASKW